MKKIMCMLLVVVLLLGSTVSSLGAWSQVTLYASDGREIKVNSSEVSRWLKVGWYEGVPMSAPDGRRITVSPFAVQDWINVGWSKAEVTLYAPDGRTMTVFDTEVEKWTKVGWYTAETLYAYDGRTISVSPFDTEKWTSVGWSRAITIYAPDGRTSTISPYDADQWTSVGWYTYPVVKMYSADGREIVVSKYSVEEYKKVGWYESKEAINSSKAHSLKYSTSRMGSVTGNITYQYNKFIGTKADVGADVLLVQTNHIPLESDASNFLIFYDYSDPLIYAAEVDGMGTYYFDNVPAGEYYILVLSKETNSSPSEQNMNITSARAYLGSRISAKGLENLILNIKIKSFEIKRITVNAGQTTRFSHDFGYTYI